MFDRVRKLFERKESAVGPMTMMMGNILSSLSKVTPERAAREGYQRNVIAYKCVNLIARSAAFVPFKLFRGDKEVEEHPLLDLLERPNPLTGRVEFLTAIYGWLNITGNSYMERVALRGQPRELWPLPPQNMKVLPGKSFIPGAYEFAVGAGKRRFEVDPVSGDSDVLQLKLFNPTDMWNGQSPLEAAGVDIDTDNLSSLWLKSLLENMATPSGAIIFDPKVGDATLTGEQFARLKAELEEKHQGARNAGRPFLLEGGLKWQQTGFSPRDMAGDKMSQQQAVRIAQAYDVPPMLVGVSGSATFNNMAEAREWLYLGPVLNTVTQLVTEWNHWLVPGFGEDLRLEVDEDGIPALEPMRERKRESIGKMVDQGLLSINEGRKQLGHEKVDGGDDILVNAGRLPLGVGLDGGDENSSEEDAKDALGDD